MNSPLGMITVLLLFQVKLASWSLFQVGLRPMDMSLTSEAVKRTCQTQVANRHKKICSPLLIIREIQIKTTMKYYPTLVKTVIFKKSTNNKCWRGCGEKGTSYTVDENVNWCNHYGKQSGGFSKN